MSRSKSRPDRGKPAKSSISKKSEEKPKKKVTINERQPWRNNLWEKESENSGSMDSQTKVTIQYDLNNINTSSVESSDTGKKVGKNNPGGIKKNKKPSTNYRINPKSSKQVARGRSQNRK